MKDTLRVSNKLMSIEHIRLSQTAKDQLIKLKRRTGIKHWNVLCRWGFCVSLAEKSIPPDVPIPGDSNVEMSWKVFGGPNHELYLAILKERCNQDGIDTNPEALARQFRLHLHRGIGYLSSNSDIKSISDLVALPMEDHR